VLLQPSQRVAGSCGPCHEHHGQDVVPRLSAGATTVGIWVHGVPPRSVALVAQALSDCRLNSVSLHATRGVFSRPVIKGGQSLTAASARGQHTSTVCAGMSALIAPVRQYVPGKYSQAVADPPQPGAQWWPFERIMQ
jgi:hypothetical protein